MQDSNALFVVQAVQLFPALAGTCRDDMEFYKQVDLIEHRSKPLIFSVQVFVFKERVMIV